MSSQRATADAKFWKQKAAEQEEKVARLTEEKQAGVVLVLQEKANESQSKPVGGRTSAQAVEKGR